MAEYYKQIKMQEYNDTYQQAQLDIVLDGQRNLASSAEIMNRLTELQQEIAKQSVNTLIPLEKTNVPGTISLKKTARPTAIKTSTTPKTGAPTLEDIQNVKLKKTPSPEGKAKKQSPFEKELEEEIKSRESSPKKISPKLTKKQKEEILKKMNPEIDIEKRKRGRPIGFTKGNGLRSNMPMRNSKGQFIKK